MLLSSPKGYVIIQLSFLEIEKKMPCQNNPPPIFRFNLCPFTPAGWINNRSKLADTRVCLSIFPAAPHWGKSFFLGLGRISGSAGLSGYPAKKAGYPAISGKVYRIIRPISGIRQEKQNPAQP